MAFHSGLTLDSKKSRSIDRRRETSRYAARDRRGKEADIFSDLKDVVPVVEESTVTHVDRIALLRVASTLCRMRKHAGPFFTKDLMIEDNPNIWNENTLSECLDGFVILADSDGTMLYITESVSIFLGLTQTDLVGRAIKDFIHPTDYDELMRISTEEAAASEEHRASNNDTQIHKYGHRMIMRMKTVISPRGRNLNLKSALFKAIVCRCRSIQFENSRIMLIHASTTPAGQGNSICMTNASVKGSETTSGSFMTRHTCDMRFSYVSENFNYLLRHESRSLMGTSFYDLVHPADLEIINETMGELFRKGHCRSPYYRLIGANNSVAWVQTEATTVNHTTRGQKGQYILCVHSLVGMQSENDSWITAGTVCSDVLAAGRPVCQYIKAEIDDVAEYLGRQPQYIDCHDFTPLIDSDAGINMSEYRPMRDVTQNQRQVPNNPRKRKLPCFLESTFGTGSDDDGEGPCRKSCAVEFCQNFWEDCPSAPSTSGLKISDDNDNDTLTSLTCRHDHSPPPIEDVDLMRCCTKHGCTDCDLTRRKDSYNEVLEWLFRDQPESPSTNSTLVCNSYEYRNEGFGGGFGNQQQPFEFNCEQPGSNEVENRRNDRMVRMGGNRIPKVQQSGQPGYYQRSSSIDSFRKQQRTRNSSITALAMDDTNRFANRAVEPTTFARIGNENGAKAPYNNGMVVDGRRENGDRSRSKSTTSTKGIYNDGNFITAGAGNNSFTSQFSPLTAGFAEFGVKSPEGQLQFKSRNPSINSRVNFPNEAIATYRNNEGNKFGNVSAIPANSYNVPDTRQCSIEGSVYESHPNMQSTMPSAGCKRNIEEVRRSEALNVDALPVVGGPEQISKEFFEEFKQQNPHLFPQAQENNQYDDMCNNFQCSSDSLEYLAPFVAEEDIMQLNSEPFPLDVSFPELDLSGYSLDTNFGKQIQPNPYSEKQMQYMKTSEDGSNIPAKRPRVATENPYKSNY